MPGAGSNFWVASFPASVPGGVTYGGGGYGTDVLTARDPLDAKRIANGFAPGASYPDGYLGNVTWDRNQDKILGALQDQNSRPYLRGVHKGEKTDPSSYFWNNDMNPDMGLQRQAAAIPEDVEGGLVFMSPRFAPTGDPAERLAHDGKTAMMTTRQQEARMRAAGGDPSVNPVQVADPSRRAQMARHLPRWSGVFQ